MRGAGRSLQLLMLRPLPALQVDKRHHAHSSVTVKVAVEVCTGMGIAGFSWDSHESGNVAVNENRMAGIENMIGMGVEHSQSLTFPSYCLKFSIFIHLQSFFLGTFASSRYSAMCFCRAFILTSDV